MVVALCLGVTGVVSEAATAPQPQTTLLVLGDSLTWGANYFAKTQTRLAATAQFEAVLVDGWWSRRIGGIISTTYSGANTYKKLVSNGAQPTAVIVALGTNDVFFLKRKREYATIIRELMDAIGNVPVVWLTVHRVESPTMVARSKVFNATLTRVLTDYPLASIHDWVSVVQKTPTAMAFDKIHLSPLGSEIRTRVYLELATSLAQRASDMTSTTTTVVPTTVAPTTSLAPTTTIGLVTTTVVP